MVGDTECWGQVKDLSNLSWAVGKKKKLVLRGRKTYSDIALDLTYDLLPFTGLSSL